MNNPSPCKGQREYFWISKTLDSRSSVRWEFYDFEYFEYYFQARLENNRSSLQNVGRYRLVNFYIILQKQNTHMLLPYYSTN